MNYDEAMLFEQDELFEEFIAMRRWDELAKETDLPLLPLAKFHAMIIKHLKN